MIGERMDTDEVRLLCVAPSASIDRLIEVDRLVPGRSHRPDLVVDVPGGPGLTVARVAAALGADVVACPILAGDAGRWIVRALSAEISAVVPVWSTGETRTTISIVSRDDESLTEILPPAEPLAIGTWEALEGRVAAELAARPVPMVVSGALPPAAPSYGVARLVRAARAVGVHVIVDAHGEALAMALAERPDVIRIDAPDAASFLGLAGTGGAGPRRGAGIRPRDESPEAPLVDLLTLAGALRERFDGIAVVTTDRGACVAVGPRMGWAVDHVATRGRFPTGGAHAFVAGLAVALARGGPLDEALRLGVAASIANTLQPGAGRLDRARVGALAAALEVRRLR